MPLGKHLLMVTKILPSQRRNAVSPSTPCMDALKTIYSIYPQILFSFCTLEMESVHPYLQMYWIILEVCFIRCIYQNFSLFLIFWHFKWSFRGILNVWKNTHGGNWFLKWNTVSTQQYFISEIVMWRVANLPITRQKDWFSFLSIITSSSSPLDMKYIHLCKNRRDVLTLFAGWSQHWKPYETFLGFWRQPVLLGTTLVSSSQVIFNCKSSDTVIPPILTVQEPQQLFIFTPVYLKVCI